MQLIPELAFFCLTLLFREPERKISADVICLIGLLKRKENVAHLHTLLVLPPGVLV